MMTRRLLLLAILGVGAFAPRSIADQVGDEFFEKTIRPILTEHCLSCHNDAKAKGKLRLTSRALLLKGGESGAAAESGKPAESAIIQAIRYVDEPRMPPKGKLSDAEIGALSKWVEMGLPWPETNATPSPAPSASSAYVITDEMKQFWAFQPVREVPVPEVKDASWPKTDLDRFILAAIEAKGLKPTAPADKRTLIRRVTFDLTGLPPSPEAIDAFLKDESPEAFARVVDRLLASPSYGERWARHWLDVVRYADSLDARGTGQPGDILDAWRYRDWVVNAFNADMPYDRFLKYQIAGDLYPPADPSEGSDGFNRSGTIATTMLAIGNWGNGDADKEKILTDIADDQVDVVSKAFMGLTVSCARCHDHKFDPIPTRDYYGLAGIFFSTHILPKLTPKGAGESIMRVSLDTPTDIAKRQAYQDRLASLQKEVQAVAAEEYSKFAASIKPRSAEHLVAIWEFANRASEASNLTLDEYAVSKGLIPFVMRQWSEAVGAGNGRLLTQKVLAIQANPDIQVWNGPADYASATINRTNQAQQIVTFRLPPRSISVHPGPASGVAVTWTSPIAGKVRVSGSVADSDPAGGDGVQWFVDHRSIAGGRELASGDIANGAAGSFVSGKGAGSLASVSVKPGDGIRLTIMPKSEYTCDTTTVELTIASWEDATVWDLTCDVVDDFLAGNPHADRLGHQAVWRFEDLGTKDRPIGATASAGQPLEVWRSAVSSGDRAQILAAAKLLADSIPVSDPKSPLMIRVVSDEVLLAPANRERLAQARSLLENHRKETPPTTDFANAAQEGGVPESSQAGIHDVKIHIRGRHDRLSDLVPRHFPTILGGDPDAKIAGGSGRRELAEWLARPEHPLTARVAINRIWQGHFGEGIVRTPSNFGKLGERPTHPDLLDFLAKRLVANHWSIKALHREILLSATYAQDSKADAKTIAEDPENRLFARMNRRRLESEAIRDELLSVSGRLDTRAGGPSERELTSPRRTLYLTTIRSDRATFGALFDQADSTAPVDRRIVTTVAPQSLFLLNHPFVLDLSRTFADRLLREVPADESVRLDHAYQILYGRLPSDPERQVGRKFLDRSKARGETVEAAWKTYAHILLCANEFIYVD